MAICLGLCAKDANLIMQVLYQDAHMGINLETTKDLPVESLCQQANRMSSEGTHDLGLSRLLALGTVFEMVADLLVRC